MDKNKAPEFNLPELTGGTVGLKDFKGKVILLTFWATWCGPCKEEMPSIEALHQQFKRRDFVVLAVAVDREGSIPVETFLAKHDYTFHVLIDSKSEVLDLYGVDRIPATFLIDTEGRIAWRELGPRNWKSPEALSLVNRLVGGNNK
jgi:peroxiredoxin